MRIALAIVGVVAILCGVLGLAYNYGSVAADLRGAFEDDPDTPYFTTVFYAMIAVCTACYIFLIVCGIQFLRKKLGWVLVFVGVQIFEVVYFFSLALLWLSAIAVPEFGRSAAAATGVANGGLMFQFLILFPLWGSVLAILAKQKLESQVHRPENPIAA